MKNPLENIKGWSILSEQEKRTAWEEIVTRWRESFSATHLQPSDFSFVMTKDDILRYFCKRKDSSA